MGTEDYSRLKKTFDRKLKALKKDNATVKKEGEKAKIRIRTLRKIFTDTDKEFGAIQKDLGKIFSEWIDRAREIQPLQAEMAEAKKSKNAAKVNELKKEILLVHKTAKAIGNQMSGRIGHIKPLRDIVASNHKALKKI